MYQALQKFHPNNGKRLNALIEASIYDGGAHTGPIFDLSGDGILDTTDLFDGNGDSDTLDDEDIPMAWQRQDGIMSQVSIARVTNGIDTLFLNYLAPPPLDFPEHLVRTGYDNRTSQGVGTIQLVTPHLTNWVTSDFQFAAIGVLRLEFAPEPPSGLLLLAGAGLLGALYRRRAR